MPRYARKPFVPSEPGPHAADLIRRGLIEADCDRRHHEWVEDWNEQRFNAKRARPKVTWWSWCAWESVCNSLAARMGAAGDHPEQNPLSADTRRKMRALVVAMRRDLERTRP